MAIKSIKATDRELADWFIKINNGEIKLPRFQRFEAWDRRRITGLLSVAVNNLPLGITLILNVGDERKFVDRYIETAEPEKENRVTEHLLDGQQRLTAFWRMMHNNYEWETYFVYIPELDKVDDSVQFDEVTGYCQTRWMKKGKKYPLWADEEEPCYRRGLIPSHLFRPDDIQVEIDTWIDKALADKMPKNDDPDFASLFQQYFKSKEELKARIVEIREIIKHYNLPFLALPAATPKETALNVFINMNTNSKPLSLFDIIVAEVEGKKGESLHDLQSDLDANHPNVKSYFNLSDLILSTSALLQDKLPNQRGMIDMDKSVLVDNWDKLQKGLVNMAVFLESQGIFDKQRLPTNAVLAVIASLYTLIPESGDERGSAEILLKKYLWKSFFSERYENSTASRAFADYKVLKNVITKATKEDGSLYEETEAPVFSKEYPLVTVEELKIVKWPKGENVRGRAILAVANYLGAYDFADGQKVSREHLLSREYHHIYPDALLKEAKIESFLALNCSLITNVTNRTIGRKDPLTYLKERYEWMSEEIVDQRLKSHLIPIAELANGGYADLGEEEKIAKIESDFEEFINIRARLVHKAAKELCKGKTISFGEVFHKVQSNQLV
ncbi:DUF262 domain-containing protein [uncultured Draconibacterium sp.]|uniref:GmrSD restriction endonuclease domain-containing protein n=1 Tax=uncultured Draconibacterium sp. TaxID=1573823 RepID=UPI002AA71CEF|nr:DUF262 domain-containing protein [uncultured Draconibacterium sp.]